MVSRRGSNYGGNKCYETGVRKAFGIHGNGKYWFYYPNFRRELRLGITFGTVGAASAPGQFPIGELRSLLDALHEKNEEDELKQ